VIITYITSEVLYFLSYTIYVMNCVFWKI